MEVGQWEPTCELRWNHGVLQQRWLVKLVEYRTYGGKERRCEGYQESWRDVPKTSEPGDCQDAVDNSERPASAR